MNIAIIPVGMLGTNCYVLASEQNNCVVIDPGAQAQKISQLIEKNGLTPKYILLTHGHHDHIGGVRGLMEHYPDAGVYIGAKDHEMLTDAEKSYGAVHGAGADQYLIPEAGTVGEGQELAVDELTIRVVETPGHTKGGVVYLCGDVMFSGDTLFAGDIGRCDLYGGDYDVMLGSLKKLSQLPGDYQVYPGHGPDTRLDQERKHNPYMQKSVE